MQVILNNAHPYNLKNQGMYHVDGAQKTKIKPNITTYYVKVTLILI